MAQAHVANLFMLYSHLQHVTFSLQQSRDHPMLAVFQPIHCWFLHHVYQYLLYQSLIQKLASEDGVWSRMADFSAGH
jgi:hypothetical protein